MTSFLDRLLGRPQTKATMGGPWLGAYQEGGINLSFLNAEPQDRAARLLQAYKVGWFNKAERKISTDFAGLDVSLAPEDEEGDNEEAEVEADLLTPWASLDPIEQFLRLMEKPNERYTGRQLRQKTMIWLDMAGWCFWYTELGTDRLPAENGTYGISPSRMWPSYDKSGTLIGYVMDKDKATQTTFEVEEIVPFSYATAEMHNFGGVGVVEAVWAQVPLTDLMAKHTGDVLSMGGRMAGAMWPKERALDEAEFEDAKRAWRNVASDPNAGRRLLIFPEPMEWAAGASTPQEIGVPELASLNRDEILTAFPISPYILGVPMPGGLNSGETRKEEEKAYWTHTVHPRAELFEEAIQTYLVPKYEAVVGFTLDFEVAEPNLDDAKSLQEKVKALDALIAAGFDEKEAVAAAGLEHIAWMGKPEPPPMLVPEETPFVEEGAVPPPPRPTRSTKAARAVEERDATVDREAQRAKDRLSAFLAAQHNRVVQSIRSNTQTKEQRAVKTDPTWWDAEAEDRLLTDTMRGIYIDVGRGGLQAVSDTLDRVILKGFTQSVLNDLLAYGGERIKGINQRTQDAVAAELAEGTRRGYSISQLVDGVPEEGYKGMSGVTLANGDPAFGDLRAETIARTETALSYNRATVTSYGEFGVRTLLAYDGDDDEVCAERNGQEFSVSEAQDIEDHPNGTLVWSPVVDKSWTEPYGGAKFNIPNITITPEFHLQPPEVNITVPEPVVNYTPPAINVPAPMIIAPAAKMNEGIQDVRIVADIQPRKEKRVIRGAPTRSNPDGPIQGIVE